VSVQRLSHIGVCVSELERSVCFYRDALGFRELSRLAMAGAAPERLLGLEGGELEAVYLERDGTRIELLYYPEVGHRRGESPCPMNRLGFTHLSLRVENLEAAIASAEKMGGAVLVDTRIDNEAWQSSAVFVTDPDGLRIELVQAPGDPNKLPGG
jgi:catechol 2,3-dioxygenase-like lactoylglutathione lyase family enzyme